VAAVPTIHTPEQGVMSRGPQPRVSGRVERWAPRPDTITQLFADCVMCAVVIGALLFVPTWLAGLI